MDKYNLFEVPANKKRVFLEADYQTLVDFCKN